jgi:hypothetical protein
MYRQTEDEIMAACGSLITARVEHMARSGIAPLTQMSAPAYNSPRARRSVQSCHRYALKERLRHAPPKDTGSYVPELSARLENDLNLSDGARRCARKLAEYTYGRDREGRRARITVSYLATALTKSQRQVQRYLRELEHAGYIATNILKAQTRMCIGLAIQLLEPLFPRHHAAKWPAKLIEPATTQMSENKSQIYKYEEIPLNNWALRCMDGVWRSFNRTYPPGTLTTS